MRAGGREGGKDEAWTKGEIEVGEESKGGGEQISSEA